MNITDTLLIAATFIGPVAAVQAQKWVERAREKRIRRLSLFQTLMATRAHRAASLEHVQALNLIELFYNGKSAKEKAVRQSWQIYYDFLAQPIPQSMTLIESKTYNEKGIDFLVKLLDAMSKTLGYDFSEVALKRGGYYPQSHYDDAIGKAVIRDSLIRVLNGQQAIAMDVTKFPVSEGAVDIQLKTQAALQKILNGDQPLQVKIDSNSNVSMLKIDNTSGH